MLPQGRNAKCKEHFGVSRLTPNLLNAPGASVRAHKELPAANASANTKAKVRMCACVCGFVPSWSRVPLKEKKKKQKTEK